MSRVWLNVDAGEHEDEPPGLWQLCDLVAIACGGHAGDDESMTHVIDACPQQVLAAHPSYPDREGFGRRRVDMPLGELAATIEAQCAALARIAAARGRRVEWVKPHGMLYHDAASSPEIAAAVLRGARAALGDDVGVIGPARSQLSAARYLREGFADRGTRADGALIPRGEPGALIVEPMAAAARAKELVGSVDTICVHADTPGALAIAWAVREALA